MQLPYSLIVGRATHPMQTVLAFFRLIFNLGNLMSIATDIQTKVADLVAKVDAVAAEVATLKAGQSNPADQAALSMASTQLDAIAEKLAAL